MEKEDFIGLGVRYSDSGEGRDGGLSIYANKDGGDFQRMKICILTGKHGVIHRKSDK